MSENASLSNVQAEPNSILCVGRIAYKFVHCTKKRKNKPQETQRSSEVLLLLCLDKRSSTHCIGFISQTLKGKSEQQSSSATREPAYQVLTQADLQQSAHNFSVCKEQQHTAASFSCYCQSMEAPRNTNKTTRNTCINLNMSFAIWVLTLWLEAQKRQEPECMQIDLILFT